MTGSDRGGYNDRSPRVAQFSLQQTLVAILENLLMKKAIF
jgi:hypothetical protein